MLDVKPALDDIEIVPVKKLDGRVAGVFAAFGKDFVTQAVDTLKLGFEGRSVERREVHAQALWTAVPGMAHLPA